MKTAHNFACICRYDILESFNKPQVWNTLGELMQNRKEKRI